MNKIELLVADLDGTLLTDDGRVTEGVLDALERLHRSPIRFLPATGRRFVRAKEIFEQMRYQGPAIVSGGSVIKEVKTGQTLRIAGFSQECLGEILDLLQKIGHFPVLMTDVADEGFDFYASTDRFATPEMDGYFAINSHRARIEPGILENPPEGIITGYLMGNQQQMESIASQLHSHLDGRFHTHVLPSPSYNGWLCEIVPLGGSKWDAIDWMAQKWEISHDRICAIGDDVNDIVMIRAAGLGIAMENGREELKSIADRIAPPNDKDGLAVVIDSLLDGTLHDRD